MMGDYEPGSINTGVMRIQSYPPLLTDVTGPAISVVLPVHNGRDYVEASVYSILNQSFRDFELLIGDDGSNDGTGQVLERLAATDSRIRILPRERKSGLAASANWVVSHARAALVAVAHADNVSQPDRLHRQVALFDAHPDVVLIGAMAAIIDADGKVVAPPNLWRLLRPQGFAPFAHSSIMFRREAFNFVGGYRDRANMWEDLDLYWRLQAVGRILALPDALSSYRQSHASVRVREKAEGVENALELMYRARSLHLSGVDHSGLLAEPQATGPIHPRIFVARSWPSVWNGQRTDLFPRLLARAALRPDVVSLQSVAFVAWASLSPRSLRWALRALIHLRNGFVRRRLRGVQFVEWGRDEARGLRASSG